jgi:hypothetical protein
MFLGREVSSDASLPLVTGQYKVWRIDLLWEAWKQVKGNRSAPGVDGEITKHLIPRFSAKRATTAKSSFPAAEITETFLLSSCFGNNSLATARTRKPSNPSQIITLSAQNSSLENS